MSDAPQTNPSAEQPATMAQVKAAVRRRIRKQAEHEHQDLNIYPMMDMMTILLVFMVMQFASSSAMSITDSEELRIPYSVSTATLEDAVPVQVARGGIIVDGRQVISLRNGVVDPSAKRGGANGFVINALQVEMCRIRDFRKNLARQNSRRPFDGAVQIVADRRTPYRTMAEVMYTLGQCEFSQLRFITQKPAAAR
jgi:biopolymer transport protein ExbD